jgi:hypothetical protein
MPTPPDKAQAASTDNTRPRLLRRQRTGQRPTVAQVRRRRLGVVGSLAGIVAVLILLLASAGGDATNQPTNLSTSASPPAAGYELELEAARHAIRTAGYTP